MHFTYKESCAAVGYEFDAPMPELVYQFIGYKDGKAVICTTEAEWKTYKLRECIATPESKSVREKYWETQHALETAARDHFLSMLKEYFSELTQAQYEICYSAAYEYGHSEGYDAVADKMEEYVDMCKSFTDAAQTK